MIDVCLKSDWQKNFVCCIKPNRKLS